MPRFVVLLLAGALLSGCTGIKRMTGQIDDSVLPGQREDVLPPEQQVGTDPKVIVKSKNPQSIAGRMEDCLPEEQGCNSSRPPSAVNTAPPATTAASPPRTTTPQPLPGTTTTATKSSAVKTGTRPSAPGRVLLPPSASGGAAAGGSGASSGAVYAFPQ